MTVTCADMPPGMKYHLKHAPGIYTYFWAIGGTCLVIVYFLCLPHLAQISAAGDKERRRKERVFTPRAHQFVFWLNLAPILFITFDFVILLNPSAVYAMEFCIHCYEAFAFVIFKKLVTLYLNGPENALRLMGSYPPKKIWAAFPLCLCWIFCYPCIPRTRLTGTTFRIIYGGVYQFAALMPTLAFLEVLVGYNGGNDTFETTINIIRFTSIVFCVYSLIVYMKAAQEPLLEYRIKGKFWVMKLTVIAASFIETILNQWGVKARGGEYTAEVMSSSIAAVTSCVFLVPLAYLCTRMFAGSDCDLSRPVFVTEDFTFAETSGMVIKPGMYDDSMASDRNFKRVSVELRRHVDDT